MSNQKWAVDTITKISKLAAKKKREIDSNSGQANAVSQKVSRPIKKNITSSQVHVSSTDWRVKKVDPATADDAQPLEDDDQARLERQAHGGYMEDINSELPPPIVYKVAKGGPGSGPQGASSKDLVGKTSSGREVHSQPDHTDHKSFTPQDHRDAASIHSALQKQNEAKVNEKMQAYSKATDLGSGSTRDQAKQILDSAHQSHNDAKMNESAAKYHQNMADAKNNSRSISDRTYFVGQARNSMEGHKMYSKSLTAKGGPGSGAADIETDKIDMPQSSHISVGTRKGVLQNMDYHEEKIPMDKITHVGQEKYVPAKLDRMLLNYGKIRKMPIDVLKVGDDYHVIDGHHRFLAAKNNEEPEINARVRVKAMTKKSALSLGQRLMGVVNKGGPGSGRTAGGGAGGKQNPTQASNPSTQHAPAQHKEPHAGNKPHEKDKGHGGQEHAAHGGAHFDPYAQLADTAQKAETTKIMKADATKQIVYGVVLTPDEIDTQMEYMSAEDIEKTAHQYMEKSRVVGKNHKNTVKAVPVESYIAPFDFTMDGGQYGSQFVKKGAWVLAVKITDPIEWQKVEDGEYTGFSIGGFGVRIPAPL